MDTSAKTSKPTTIKLSDVDTIAKLEELRPEGKSNPEFLKELLESYEKFSGKNCSEEDQAQEFFKNITGSGDNQVEKAKHKKDKEVALKEMFELDPDEDLKMNEYELLKKASEISKKSIQDMGLEGRILVAKNEIGRHIQYNLGKGKKGTGDANIAQIYEFLQQTEGKITKNILTRMSGSNRKTVESWCERNDVTCE